MEFSHLKVAALTLLIAGCNGGGGGGGASAAVNKFTASGDPLTIDGITSSIGTSEIGPLSTSVTYYGRVAYIDGSDVYGANVHFTLNKNDNDTAYFSDFSLDKLYRMDDIDTSTSIVTVSDDLTVTASYDSNNNGLEVVDANSRFVEFNLNFGDNTHFNDVFNGGVIFSNDFSTMVGGDNSTFIFIAQKADSLGAAVSSDVDGSYGLVNFQVSGLGAISLTSTSSITVSGTGGNGFKAFRGNNSNVGTFGGELTLTDPVTGFFLFGYDIGYSSGTPTADDISGAFITSPDKQYVLGYSFTDGLYFAASK